MSAWALALTVVLYGVTALDLFAKGKWPLAGAFVCYAVANIFFLLESR